ncbi:MAG: hypothetical protein IPP88_21945 [Betaproteobacteria bacterium]|nr:hypothetical protein [Betaproteobacteria bacterium]
MKQILIHGVYDGIVPPAIGLRYQMQAKGKGESIELVTFDNAGLLELIAPWTAGRKVVERIVEAVKCNTYLWRDRQQMGRILPGHGANLRYKGRWIRFAKTPALAAAS